MRYTLSIAFLLLALFCHGQGVDGWKLIASVEEEAQKKYTGPARVMDIDSLTGAFFASGKVRVGIDTLACWQVMFSKSIDWTHVVGQKMPPISFDHTPQKDIKAAYANAKSYSGAQLFKSFGIIPARLSNTAIPGFPLIHAREDPSNRVWIPYTDGDYLVLRYVHSYPNGNQTSFYHEIILYFRKVDHL